MKKRRILIAGGALLLSAFAACEPYLSREEALDGKACGDSEPSCAAGYRCILSVCERDLETGAGSATPSMAGQGGASAGAEGTPGTLGTAGASTAPAGASSEPEPTTSAGAGGMPGSAGTGAVSMNPGGGSGGDEPAQGPSGPPDAGCANPVPLYPDLDADGFGTEAGSIMGCPRDGFAIEAGDCFDAPPTPGSLADDVFPDQARFFTEPYRTSAGGDSFDYDCSGDEDPDPDNDFVSAPTDCEERVGPLGCGSSNGYVTPENPRTGDGVDPLCGTRGRVQCAFTSATGCGLVPINGDLFPCH